jgi:hypothetical protein
MGKHHTAFLQMFKQMMIGVFGPGMEKMLGRVSPYTSSTEVGETSSAQPPRDTGAQPPLQSQPIQPPPQSVGGQPVQPPLQSMGVSQSSHLYKTIEVNRFSSQTRISLHMGTWRSVRLEYRLILLTR